MNKDLVNYYYDKILAHFKKNRRYNAEYDIGHTNMLNLIKKLVKTNRDYLLTESFIDYITMSSMFFSDTLSDICSDDELRQLMCLNTYFLNIYQKYFRYGPNNSDSIKNTFVEYLKEDVRLATIKAYEVISFLQNNYPFNGEERYIIRIAVISILSNCVLNKELSKFNEMMDVVITDPNYIVDDIEVNNLDIYEDEYLIVERVVRIMEPKYKGSIK